MRKNSPRKWLHACLDLLPVILIPVFMIYSHRHDINDGSIQVQEKQVVDFNQIMDVESYLYETSIEDDYVYWDINATQYNIINFTNLEVGHVYYYKNLISFTDDSGYAIPRVYINGTAHQLSNTSPYINFRFTATTNRMNVNFSSGYVGLPFEGYSSLNIFDLTQMFGVGNEPTIEQFNLMFPNYSYDYTLSHKELIDGDLVTYNDTDIMSQFTYQLYNSVDKYFNMGNVFNLNGVYDWFNLNIFNGSSPIYIYVVWQIVLYEFVMDLLFLLYGLFMWFIDMVQHLMDKPFKSIK